MNKQTKNEMGMRKSPQIWSVDRRMAQRCKKTNKQTNKTKQRFLTPEGSRWYMLIPQDCTARRFQNYRKIFYHAQNANDVEPPGKQIWQSMQSKLLASEGGQINTSFDPTSA